MSNQEAKMVGGRQARDDVEDLRQQLAKLQLTMQQWVGVDANYFSAHEGNEQGEGEWRGEAGPYGTSAEVYIKRVAEFEPIPLPRKRAAAAPGQVAPRFPHVGAVRGVQTQPRRAVDTPPGAPNPQPYAGPGAAAPGGGMGPIPNPPNTDTRGPAAPMHPQAPPRWPPVGRPRRTDGGARTDPVPGDPQEEEQRIAEDIVNKINRYPLPLGVALKCDTSSIYAKVVTKLNQATRLHTRGRQLGAAPPGGGTTNAAEQHNGPTPMVALVTEGEGLEAMATTDNPSSTPNGPRLQVCKAMVHLTNAYGDRVPVVAVVDSGASHTVIPYDTVRKLDLIGAMEDTPVSFINADGNRGRAAGVVRGLKVSLGDMTMCVDAFVSRALNYGILLGTDFLYPIRATLCYDKRRLEYTNDAMQRSSVPIYFMRSMPGLGSCMHLQWDDEQSTDEEAYLQQVIWHPEHELECRSVCAPEAAVGTSAPYEHTAVAEAGVENPPGWNRPASPAAIS